MPTRWSPSRDTWQTTGRGPRGTRFQNAGWIEKNAQPPGSSVPKGTRKPRRWEPFERHRQHGMRSARSARRAGVCVEKNAQPPEPARAARDAEARWSPREDACHEVERSGRSARRAARQSTGDAWPLRSACRKARMVRAVGPFDRRLPDRASGPYGDARRTGEWLARNAQPVRPARTERDVRSGRLSPSRDPCQKSSDPQWNARTGAWLEKNTQPQCRARRKVRTWRSGDIFRETLPARSGGPRGRPCRAGKRFATEAAPRRSSDPQGRRAGAVERPEKSILQDGGALREEGEASPGRSIQRNVRRERPVLRKETFDNSGEQSGRNVRRQAERSARNVKPVRRRGPEGAPNVQVEHPRGGPASAGRWSGRYVRRDVERSARNARQVGGAVQKERPFETVRCFARNEAGSKAQSNGASTA